MDVTLLISVAAVIVVLIVICTVFLGRRSGTRKKSSDVQERVAAGRPVRRAAGQRVARRRMQAAPAQQPVQNENESGDEANDEAEDIPELSDHKIGAKKRAKLAAKAEKKVQREAAERDREERKKKEQVLQEERDKQTEKEKEEELRLEEAEKKAREEKERKEHEEYLKMKEAFNVEEEGYDGEEEEKEAEENLLQQFVDYIKENKVVVLEDLAATFSLRTVNVVERIQELQATGTLTGVIDDRGKFIYISQSELDAVAKFVQQRGRVSITELAENSNKLINLNPEKTCSMVEAR